MKPGVDRPPRVKYLISKPTTYSFCQKLLHIQTICFGIGTSPEVLLQATSEALQRQKLSPYGDLASHVTARVGTEKAQGNGQYRQMYRATCCGVRGEG